MDSSIRIGSSSMNCCNNAIQQVSTVRTEGAAAAATTMTTTYTTITTTATATTTTTSGCGGSTDGRETTNMKRNEEILERQSQVEYWKSRLAELERERKHLIALQQVRLSPQDAWCHLSATQRTSKEFVLAALGTPQPEYMGLPHSLQWPQLSAVLKNLMLTKSSCGTINSSINDTNNNNNRKKRATARNNHPRNYQQRQQQHVASRTIGDDALSLTDETSSLSSSSSWPDLLLDRDVVLARIARCDFMEFWSKDPFVLTPALAGDVQVMSALMEKDVMALRWASPELLRPSPPIWKVLLRQFENMSSITAMTSPTTSAMGSSIQEQELSSSLSAWDFPYYNDSTRRAAAAAASSSPSAAASILPVANAHTSSTRGCPLKCLKYLGSDMFSNRTYMLELVQATAFWGDAEEQDVDDDRGDDDDDDFDDFDRDLDDLNKNGPISFYYDDAMQFYYYYQYHLNHPYPNLSEPQQPNRQRARGNDGRLKREVTSVLSYIGAELRQDKAFMLQVLNILTQPLPTSSSSAAAASLPSNSAQTDLLPLSRTSNAATTTRPYPTFLKWCSRSLQDDANFVMKVIRAAGGFNLKYASRALRTEYNLCRTALASCPWAICFCIIPNPSRSQRQHHQQQGPWRGHRLNQKLHPNAFLQQQCIDRVTFWQEQVFGQIILYQQREHQQLMLMSHRSYHPFHRHHHHHHHRSISSRGGLVGCGGKRLVPPMALRHETAVALWKCVPPQLQQDRTLLLMALEAGILTWSQIPPSVYQVAVAAANADGAVAEIPATTDAAATTTTSGIAAASASSATGTTAGGPKNDGSVTVVNEPVKIGKNSREDAADDVGNNDSDDDDDDEDSDVDDFFGNIHRTGGRRLRRQHRHHEYGHWATSRLGLGLFDDDDDGDLEDADGPSSSSSFRSQSSRNLRQNLTTTKTTTTITTTSMDQKFCRTFLQQALERNPTVYLSWTEEQQADPDLAWCAIRSCCQKLKEQQEQQRQHQQLQQQQHVVEQPPNQREEVVTIQDNHSTTTNDNRELNRGIGIGNNNRGGSIAQGLMNNSMGGDASFLIPSSLALSSSSSAWLSSFPMTDALEDVVAEASVHVPDVVWQDWQVVQYLVQSFVGEDLFQWLPLDMRQDRELMLLACQADGHLLEYCDEALWYDRDIVQAALQQNPLAADHLPEIVQLFHIPVIVQAVMNCSEEDIDELSHVVEEEVWLNRDVILAWIRRGRDVRDVWDDFDVILADARLAWILTDEELWLTMAECNETEFGELAPEALRRNVAFMTQCVERNGRVLVYALVDDNLLSHVGTLVTTAFATSTHAIEQFIDPAKFEFMVKASRQIRDDLELHQGFLSVLCGIQNLPQPYEQENYLATERDSNRKGGSSSGSCNSGISTNNIIVNHQQNRPVCYLPLLNQGLETTLIFKKTVAEYAGVPIGKQLRLLRQASDNLAAWGF